MSGDTRLRPDWHKRLNVFLANTVAVSVAVNVLSNDYRWRVLAAAMVAVTISVAAYGLRRLPPTSTIVRLATRAMVLLAAAAAVVAATTDSIAGLWAAFVAVALVVGATAVAERRAAIPLLGSASAIGMGSAYIVLGALVAAGRSRLPWDALMDYPVMAGVALIGGGLGGMAFGVAIQTRRIALGAAAWFSCCAAVICLGLIGARGNPLVGAPIMVIGLVGLSAGAAVAVGDLGRVKLAVLGCGTALVALALGGLFAGADPWWATGVACSGLGTALLGFTDITDHAELFWIAMLGVAAGPAEVGVVQVINRQFPQGLGMLLFSAVVVAYVVRTDQERLKAWWSRVTADQSATNADLTVLEYPSAAPVPPQPLPSRGSRPRRSGRRRGQSRRR
ncbi:hypothetical protein [Micromonospora phaseoli]|uniref:hypothetical protein n=1 Tax=Micromonospora phaseoli TaxID=1144548 RepID=UPI001113ADE5|nr:hypothetical protein [Micromonospora phaseoli]